MKSFVLLAFLLSLTGAASWAQPAATDGAGTTDATAATLTPAWQSFDHAVAAADTSGKMVLIDVYAPWCGWCNRMQRDVYADSAIVAYLGDQFEVARLNVDDKASSVYYRGVTMTPQELGRAFGATGTPTTVFLDSTGTYLTRLPGYVNADTFGRVLRYIGSGAYRDQTLQEYVLNSTVE